jgi:hypothetical protein
LKNEKTEFNESQNNDTEVDNTETPVLMDKPDAIIGTTKGKDLDYIFEDLKMPKPFKRDKNRERLFNKTDLIKQIRKEQKERYQ